MVWARNGTPHTLSATGDTITISDLTEKQFNQFIYHVIPSGTINNYLGFDNDTTASNYAIRYNYNGGTDTAGANTLQYFNVNNADELVVVYTCNISGEEKLSIAFSADISVSGYNNPPSRGEFTSKWVTTSGQFSRADVINTQSGSFDTGSNLTALNGDTTEETILGNNVQSGSRFEATDTRKIYYLSPPTSPDYNYPMDSALTSEVASYVFVTSGELKHVVQRGTSRVGYQDLGANLSSNWVFTMKVRIPARSGTSSNQTAYYLLSSSTTNQDSDQPSPTGNAIGITINLRSNGSAEDGSNALNVGNTYAYNLAQDSNSYRFIPVNTEITKWLKMIKNGNTITYTIHDSVDDMYNSVLTSGSDTGSITNATAGAFSNLRYFKVHNVVGQSTTVETMYVDDVKIYDGVTSMPNPNSAWTEEA
jgi:hypothetical protein